MPLLATALFVVPATFAQSSDWRECLPFPTFAEEIAAMNGVESHIKLELKDIHFIGVNNLPLRDRQQIAASLKQIKYTVQSNNQEAWVADLAERARDEWQRRGYYAARINKVEPRVLATYSGRASVSVTVDLQEGPQYRLGTLTFRNNKRFSRESLRTVFPLRDGDVFATDKIRQGLFNLRSLYNNVGYINYVGVPNEHMDQRKNSISLDVVLDEGNQYRVGDIQIVGAPSGLDEKSALHELGLKPGDVYNQSLVSSFYDHFVKNPPENAISRAKLIVKSSSYTVDLIIEMNNPKFHCPDWTSLYVDR